ncbi:hypothetical protein [Curtobacterium sp. MCSS17_008]|uniref:hypothetical protein n=1 Tax=Curtobacterium sp. MCSS17_008 TaxID=2175647 RepID=UPI0011B731A7|nr:hypothetical protein [Curtobacterium sp. MCSS17_008]
MLDVASLVVVLALAGLSTGCASRVVETRTASATDPTLDAVTAKQQMVDAVDDATGLLGGEWTARTGPDAPERCTLPDGERGAHWRYLTGSTIEGRPEEDGTAMANHWRSQGMSVTVRDTSTGPVVFGGGSRKIASISFYAVSGNSTVQAVSLCFPGDADRMAEDDVDEVD